jgi:dihydrofolate reductase
MSRALVSFMVMTLDGFTEGPNQEFDWPNVDDEFNDFAIRQLNAIDTLVFGRKTYEGMASYWPTPDAVEGDPVVAGLMNSANKIVFSKTLKIADWNNTTLIAGDARTTIAELKRSDGKDIAIFGSGDLTVDLIEAGLVDELRAMVHPILLGGGRSLFAGLHDRVALTLSTTTVFSSGNVLLSYRPK